MRKEAKEYMDSVVETIIRKHHISEIEAYKMVKKSFLYDSLLKFPEETIHDDIETNADFIYEDFISDNLLEM